MSDMIVGIDLGTTNSEVAAFLDDRVSILGHGGQQMLPSCVGVSPAGELLIGQAARNQHMLYPDRTVRSIKRKMGTHEPIRLADRTYTPPDISALILRQLVRWAEQSLGTEVGKAVITVPAYFSDAQRQATREAGALAGLEVMRLINEPTAASLAYGYGGEDGRTVMVYDLGGGTFDVSIVEIQDQVTQVLASHGNNQLGGDDFDQLLVAHLVAAFKGRHGVDLTEAEHRGALVRVAGAAEAAKKRLSFEPCATVREEALVQVDGKPLHLELEVARETYEAMIRPLVETTLESVSKALLDAGRGPGDIDLVLLVGGSSRTPLVRAVLEQRMGRRPRQDVHPDLCVALGAGLMATRLAGRAVEKVLVDISPYSFGVSYLGERDGVPYAYCYEAIIERNTPLPVTRTQRYCTASPYQREVEMNIFQGDNSDALQNTLVGEFTVEGLTPEAGPNEVDCRMKLDLDGILEVTAIEKKTALSRKVSIADALKPKTDAQLAEARRRLEALFASRGEDDADLEDDDGEPMAIDGSAIALGADDGPAPEAASATTATAQAEPEARPALAEGRALVERCRGILDRLHADDRVEAVDMNEAVETAIANGDAEALAQANDALREFLFFVEGR